MNCTTFRQYCNAGSHHDKERCILVMDGYYKYRGTYVCPVCETLTVTSSFKAFLSLHGEHLTPFKNDRKTTVYHRGTRVYLEAEEEEHHQPPPQQLQQQHHQPSPQQLQQQRQPLQQRQPQEQEQHQQDQQSPQDRQYEEEISPSFNDEIVVEDTDFMRDAACASLDASKSLICSLYDTIKAQNARILQMEKAEADLLFNQQIEKQNWLEETRELKENHQTEMNIKTTELCRLDDSWSLKEDQWMAKETEFQRNEYQRLAMVAEYQRKEEQWLAREVELLREIEEKNLRKFSAIEEVLEVATEGLTYRIENWIQLEEEQILNTVCDVDLESDPFQQPSTSGKTRPSTSPTRPLFIGLELPMPPLRKRKADD